MKWTGQIVQLLVVAIVVGAIVFFFMRGGGGSQTFVTVEQITKIAELATINYRMSVTHYHEKPPVGLEWLPAKLFVTVKGDIKGSVNMQTARITLPKEGEEKIVKIFFPKDSVIISNPQIGPKDVSFLTCSNPNPFHPLADKDYTAAQKEAISAMIKTANDDGIKLKTAREAREVLVNFLAALGHKVEVAFEEKELNATLGTATPAAELSGAIPDSIATALPGMDGSGLASASRQFCANGA
ncbi:MAG: DUF4230 domain-containing protein [Pseudomonadota bacterium]